MDTYAVCPKCQTLNRIALERAEKARPHCGRCKTDLPVHGGVQDLNEKTMKALIEKSPRLVVIDYWAPWCAPCKSFAPTYEEAAQELAGQVVFGKLNTESHPQAANAHHIRGIPTLAIFRAGREVDRQTGAFPLPQLLQYLRQWSETSKVA